MNAQSIVDAGMAFPELNDRLHRLVVMKAMSDKEIEDDVLSFMFQRATLTYYENKNMRRSHSPEESHSVVYSFNDNVYILPNYGDPWKERIGKSYQADIEEELRYWVARETLPNSNYVTEDCKQFNWNGYIDRMMTWAVQLDYTITVSYHTSVHQYYCSIMKDNIRAQCWSDNPNYAIGLALVACVMEEKGIV